MKCSCGTEFNDSFAFCPSCGKPNPTKVTSQISSPTQQSPDVPAPSVTYSQNAPIVSRSSFGIVSIILLVIAVLILFGGNFLAAVSIGAAGICLCKPVRAKIPVNKVVLYGIVGVLIFFGIACIAAEDEEFDNGSSNRSYSIESNDSSKKSNGGDYYLEENVAVDDWIVTVHSVDVDTVGTVTVTCNCTVANASKRNLEFVSSNLFALDNNGILTEAFSHDNYNVVAAGKSFDTTLIFNFSDQSNTDPSLMTMYIANDKTRVHFSETNDTDTYDEQHETFMRSESSWAAKYNQFYGTNYGKPLYIETTDDEGLTVITTTPSNLDLICWFDLSPDEIGNQGQLFYSTQMSQEGDTLDVYSDYELTYVPNDNVVILSSEKENYYEYFTVK